MSNGGPGSPTALTVDNLPAPVGVGLNDVSFGWHIGDPRGGILPVILLFGLVRLAGVRR